MSMTMTAFIDKSNLPTPSELEAHIKTLGHDFKFTETFTLLSEFGGDCELDGQPTFFEVYYLKKEEVIADMPFKNIEESALDAYDAAFSFVWGADGVAGACISLLSVALMDLRQSKVVFEDFEVWYDRNQLLQEVPMVLEETSYKVKVATTPAIAIDQTSKQAKIIAIVMWSLLIITTLLMNRKMISWHLPALFLGYIVIKSVIDHHKKA